MNDQRNLKKRRGTEKAIIEGTQVGSKRFATIKGDLNRKVNPIDPEYQYPGA